MYNKGISITAALRSMHLDAFKMGQPISWNKHCIHVDGGLKIQIYRPLFQECNLTDP